MRLVVRFHAGTVDDGLALGNRDRRIGVGDVVVGDGIKHAGRYLRR
jgi:hypothetical protein